MRKIAGAARSGEECTIDLRGLRHDRGHHADIAALSTLAWWLLSTDLEVQPWSCRLPETDSAPFIQLARAGVLTAARLRQITLLDSDGFRFEPATHPSHQLRLPGVDWAILDQVAGGERLRVIPDLADPRRARPLSPEPKRLSYPWLAKLGLASGAISASGYRRFVADADYVTGELVDNVHDWSEANRAFAAISTTRGSSNDGNWNRLHIVIADDGIGIPSALRCDVEALSAVHGAEVSRTDSGLSLTDEEIVERLMRYAFGTRELPNHNGHGLNVAQVRSGQWVGSIDVSTTASDGRAFCKTSRGVNPQFLTDPDLGLPGVKGTLIHVLLQATDRVQSGTPVAEKQLALIGPGNDASRDATVGLSEL